MKTAGHRSLALEPRRAIRDNPPLVAGGRRAGGDVDMDRDRLEAERALVEAARRGDQEARENLLEPMVSMLRRHIERRLDGGIRRKVSSSDVIQEIRITVYGKISDFEYRGPRSLDRWVWSIADTKLREATRRYVDPERRRAAREV